MKECVSWREGENEKGCTEQKPALLTLPCILLMSVTYSIDRYIETVFKY